jgi:hypothetical protein
MVGAIPASEKGKAGGVASLGSDGKVPAAQLPEIGAVKSVNGQTGAVVLDADDVGARANDWMPTAAQVGAIAAGTTAAQLGGIASSEKGAKSGVATLDSSGKVPSGQLPSMNYIPTSQKGAAGGVASLDSSGKLVQMPTAQDVGAANKSTSATATLLASSWADKSYTLSVSGVTATSNQEILPSLNITKEQLEALQAANIQDGGQASGKITLKAFGDVPTVDIPIRVILRGDS